MNTLRYTDTNSGDDSQGRAFGLEGNLYLVVVAAVVAAVALFAVLVFLVGLGMPVAAMGAAVPVALTLSWVVVLKHGKPRGYDRDVVNQALGGGNASRAELSGRTHDGAPEGWFVEGMIVFGAPSQGAVVAKGFWLEPSDRRGASFERLNACHEELRNLLGLATPGRRLQFQWWPDSDYHAAVRRHHERSAESKDSIVRAVGNRVLSRYWPAVVDRKLRRERVAVFLSIEVEKAAGAAWTREGLCSAYAAVLDQMKGQFEEFAGTLRGVLGSDTPVRPMDDLDHFVTIRGFLNPSLELRPEEDPKTAFDPERFVQENCWHCDCVGLQGGGFTLDGYRHAILAVDRWPRQTRPGIVTYLTGLSFLEYRITVNITPALSRSEIGREEKAAERLRGEYAEKPRSSVLVALRKKDRKIEQLASGQARPFRVTYLIRVWGRTEEVLRERVAAVQAAIHAIDGAQYVECALSATALKLFFASWPGWTHSSYGHRELYAEDTYLADLVPFSATFTGLLEEAEALFDGVNGNLVGVATQIGGSPQHALVAGMSGAGKSQFLRELCFQTAGEFAYTMIADIGFSHREFTEAMGEKPLVVHPDAEITLNYLDTLGTPLTQLHLASAAALLSRMVGVPDEPEELALRQAQLTVYLQQLYRDTFLDWARMNPERAAEVTRFACAVVIWRERMAAGTTALDAFFDLRDRVNAGEPEAREFMASISEETLTRFAQEPKTERIVWRTACAYYGREDFPTHSALVEQLAFARRPEHAKDEIDRLATLLRAWCANGQYGKLFDGKTNVRIDGKVAHFEMGMIPEQAVELRAAVGLLISGLARQHIISLPRALRKRVIFEEMAQFLDVPGGEQIVAESYAQLRKHNCWAVSVVQQYSRFRESRVRSAVIGNTKQYFLLRQADRGDMKLLADDIGLPESAVEAIQNYPMPEQQPEGNRFSSVCYFVPTAQPPQCGTLRYYGEAKP
jgi:type IV secretion system protein TrbE